MRINYDLTITPWKMDDLDNLVLHANNKNIANNLTDAFPFPYTHQDGIKFIETYSDEIPTRVFAIRINDIAVGSVGIFPQPDVHCKNAEMGYWLAEKYWGIGIVTKVVKQIIEYGFNTFDIDRIFARPFGTNLASQKVLEKAGMAFETRFEKTIFKNFEYKDELFYAIRRSK